ncbi:MAG TPA: polymer-forming cytoskeletal protein [Chthoniobacteraceae bacterium]|jgi:cytoskeletal protein CcmA (bactofilin family)|nr:polymer-forming cytoskeletal protein [Chthoniobacteraceae bacterium]
MSQPPPAPSRNFLSQDVEIKGTITFGEELVTHGKIEGEVHSTGQFTIGKTGVIQGDITAARVSVHGVVNGNIAVTERCELRGAAQLHGDLESPSLVIEEGATFIGRSSVKPKQPGGAIAGGGDRPQQQPKK